MTDMRYMDELENVAADAVGLIREKTATYGDSWKKRGGPGAWFTVARPMDRLEGIMQLWNGDIFAAIERDPSGADGTALACVRDILNYMILIEAHARVVLGARPHGPERPVSPAHRRIASPEDGSHHALHEDVEEAAEVTQDTGGAGGSGPSPRSATLEVALGGFQDDRISEFVSKAKALASLLGLTYDIEWETRAKFQIKLEA